MIRETQAVHKTGNIRTRKSFHLLLGVLTLAMMIASLGVLAGTTSSADAASRCTGATSNNLVVAKSFYNELCSRSYNQWSGVHRCDYRDRKFTCSGPGARNSFCRGFDLVDEAGPISSNTYKYQSKSKAKTQFRHVCKEDWNGSSGHHGCAWNRSSGWLCYTWK